MTIRSQAWNLLCEWAHNRASSPREVLAEIHNKAREITGTPWADCVTEQWVMIIDRLGGAA